MHLNGLHTSLRFIGDLIDLENAENWEEKKRFRQMMLNEGFSSDEAQKLYALVDLGYSCTEIIQILGKHKRHHSLIKASNDISDFYQFLNDKNTSEAIGKSVNLEQLQDFPNLLQELSKGI